MESLNLGRFEQKTTKRFEHKEFMLVSYVPNAARQRVQLPQIDETVKYFRALSSTMWGTQVSQPQVC